MCSATCTSSTTAGVPPAKRKLRFRPAPQHPSCHSARRGEGISKQKSTLVSNKPLHVLTWNAANLIRNRTRLHELDHIISLCNADVAVVTETELGQDDIAVIPGFNMFRSLPGTNGKSRLLIYTKNSLQVSVFRVTPMEIWLTVNLAASPLTIAGIYRQWHDDERLALENFYSNCSDALKFSRILVLGDFNLDIDRINDSSYSRAAMAADLAERMESLGYFFAGPNSPTYFSYGSYNGSKRTSTIDLVYAHGLAPSVAVLDYAATDHRPVLATVTSAKATLATNSDYVRNLRKVSAAAFCQAIDAYLPGDFYQIEDVDAAQASLVAAVTLALDELAPLKLAKPKQVNGFNLSLAADTLEAIRQRDATSPSHPLFRSLRNRAKKLVRRDTVLGAMKAADANANNPKKLWDFARQQMGYTRPSLPSSLCASDINNYFIEKIKKIRQEIPEDAAITKLARRNSRDTFQFKFPSASKSREVIRSLKNTGALGVDSIGVAALKLGADSIAAPLAHIARLSFNQGVYPTGYKTAIVSPVYKGRGKPALDASSYRPISILPAMSEVLELLVMEPLASHLSELLPNSQFGFRAHRSTVGADRKNIVVGKGVVGRRVLGGGRDVCREKS